MSEITEDTLQMPPVYRAMHSLSAVAVSINMFAIYVILYHTPSQMKEYSWYLLYYQIVATVTDITVMWLIAPWFSFPVLGLIPTGPLTTLGISTGPQVVAGFVLFAFVIITMGELFYKRQQTILPNWSVFNCQVKKRKGYVWHCFLHSWVLIALVVPSTVLRLNECDQEMIGKAYPSLRAMVYHKDFMCIGDEFVTMATYFMIYIAVQVLTCLSVLVISMIFHLHNLNIASKKTRDMQRSLLRILIIQTVVPLGFMFVPFVLFFYIVESGRADLVDWNPWLVLVISMHGPCSTILILVLYTPYYRFLMRLLGRGLGRRFNNQIVVLTIPHSQTSYGPTERVVKSKSLAI